MLCFHTHVKQFTGIINFVPGPQAKLHIDGVFFGALAYKPFSISVELPQHRSIPWLLQALTFVSVGFIADWNKPRVTLPSLQFFDFEQWILNIPFIGAWSMQDLCGYLPVHIVLHQSNQEFVRIVVQRRKHCTHVQHLDNHEIKYIPSPALQGNGVKQQITL